MKNYLKIMLGLIAVILLYSCQPEREFDCTPIEPFEVKVDSLGLSSVILSPSEKGKLWLKVNGRAGTILDIDIKNGQSVVLDEPIKKLFNAGNNQYVHKDQYDSIVWIGGTNRNLMLFNQRDKSSQELSLDYVTKIVSRPNEVYFVRVFFIGIESRSLLSKLIICRLNL
jgi:hypothetical protein